MQEEMAGLAAGTQDKLQLLKDEMREKNAAIREVIGQFGDTLEVMDRQTRSQKVTVERLQE